MGRALLAVIASLLLLASPAAVVGAEEDGSTSSAPIEAGLLQELDSSAGGRFFVDFAGRADLRGAARIHDFAAQGQYVLETLQATQRSSQSRALALVAGSRGARAESFWLTNTLLVTGDSALAQRLAALPGVTRVRRENFYPLVKPVATREAILGATSDPEPGITTIRADEAWEQGILGSGVTVANIDTGVEYTHPALVQQYRGNEGAAGFDHDYDWWDPTGICGDEPCDNAGHGTHTMGTMVGGDGPGPFSPDIGVAPGATWIAAKGCEDFGCSEGALLSSGEFVLAPTDLAGENPEPALRPDIVNNSWGGDPADEFYLEIVQAWRAAGMVPVFAAGNSGPECGSVGAPGGYLESFSVGATTFDDEIAEFSSRGPSLFGKIAPDVSAPGVNVVSSVPGEGYEAFDGTSMAAPHTAGALALILSARPALVGQVDAMTGALRDTAVDILDDQCGGDEDGDPNNVYGDGRIDAFAAVQLVATGGTLTGVVRDGDSREPIAGARVQASDGTRQFPATADENGRYELFLAAGSYRVRAEAFGYQRRVSRDVVVETDQTTTRNFRLTALPRYTISGEVRAAEDGTPLGGATVQALGAPVEPARTDDTGHYELTLPEGEYVLEAAAGGCTEAVTAEVVLQGGDETRDFRLARKIDDFGHGCRSIPFGWVDAQQTTALSGDEFHGRLDLPFDFAFYGESYDQVFISDNGYLAFIRPEFTNPFPVGIPSSEPPDAAIYALWQDLYLDDGSTIEYEVLGTAPERTFVIEYSDVRARTSSSAQLDLEVKLHERGETVDILYGAANPANPGDGRNATIGLEDASATDALQFSFFERRVRAGSAYRYETVPAGQVSGTVVDANDGLPVAGATVTAAPGGRSATADGNGDYTLRLRPGEYTLRATAEGGYRPRTKPATVTDGGNVTVSFRLRAAIAELSVESVTESVGSGETGSATFTLSNPGSAALRWQARERELEVTPPDLPVISQAILRRPTWERFDLPAGLPRVSGPLLDPGLLTPIIEDPAGDATGSVDVTTVRGGSDGTELGLSLEFTEPSAADQAVGFVFFDTDQDESTGLPPEELIGSPEQDIGVDYFADLFAIHDPDPAVLIVSADFEIVAIVPATVGGGLVAFDVPLEALGEDDGSVDVAMVLGDFSQPTDLAPDAGHGIIEPFADAAWMDLAPEEGRVAPGEDQRLTLTLGGPDTGPALYEGILAFLSNAPRQPLLQLPVELTVGLPDTFGSLRGRVTDAHSGEPLQGARVILRTGSGTPDISVSTDERGRYELFGPAGTWTLEVRRAGFVPGTQVVQIEAGAARRGVHQALHARQPHAALTGDPIELELTPGEEATASLTLGNEAGHAALDFQVTEAAARSSAGTATWLYRASEPVRLEANRGGRVPARPSAYRWQAAAPSGTGSILVYADDPVHPAPRTYVDLALQGLGLGYTAFYEDWAGFEDALVSGGWDLVLVANDNIPPDVSTLDAMADYVAGGGLMAIHSWTVGFEPGHPLWSLLGISFVADDTDPPDPVYWWDPGHPLFNDPESVPEVTQRDGDIYGIYGQHVAALDGSALAGYTTPGPDPEEAAIVLGASENTIFKGFVDGDNSADLDDDGQLDGVEIWTNMIQGLFQGFSTDVPWLSVAPSAGRLAVGATTELEVRVDTTGLAPGRYGAQVVVRTNDPQNRSLRHPVTLVVPRSSMGINAGGPAYTTGTGDDFRADRAFAPGGFGYVGASDPMVRSAPIAGTTDDGLYQDARQGMRAYRLDVPDGRYRVDLHFAELGGVARAERRLFDVTIEGTNVLDNLNVAEAAGGRFRALVESFVVRVRDGDLRIGFDAGRGRTLINALRVTGLP